MYKPYNNEKLNGKPRMIETRVFHVDRESGAATYIGHIPVIAGGPHSSDCSYTPFGALENEFYYDVLSDSIVVYECGEYHAAFDEHHNMTSEEYHYEDPSGKTDDQEYTFENEYDGKGRLIRQTGWGKRNDMEHETIADFDGNGQICRKTTYQYYKPTKHYHLSIVEMFAYNNNGKLTQMTVTDESGRVRREETMVYDDDGVLLRKIIRRHGWEEVMRFSYRKTIEYFISISTWYDEKKIHYRSSLLDGHGNIVAAHLHDNVSTLEEDGRWKYERRDTDSLFEYIYDAHGNWTRQDLYLKGNHYYVTRKIEYYE